MNEEQIKNKMVRRGVEIERTLNAVMLSGFRSSSFINSNAFSPNIIIIFYLRLFLTPEDIRFSLCVQQHVSRIKNKSNRYDSSCSNMHTVLSVYARI